MGRRRRRLRRVAAALGAVAFVALGVVVWLILGRRTEIRRPGEALDEITQKLSRDLPEDAPLPRLADVTAAAGLAPFRTFTGDRTSQLPEDMGAGLAWGDFDNDGDDDLFLVGAGTALDRPATERTPSELWENLGDGTFRRLDSFPETRIQGMAAAWGDFDADGWLDLVVTGYRTLQLFHNESGRLVPSPALPALDGYWAGAAWGDFDNDRDLDLYVCGYVRYEEDAGGNRRASDQYGTAVPYTLNPASFEPEPNLLFANLGDGTFEEVAALYGVSNPGGRSLSALWHDFDDDGRLDLYVANDISDNALFLNRGDTFEDAGLTAWVADYRGAMGLTAGDWNRDGDDDLFVTHWLAQENALYDSRRVDVAATRDPGREAPPLTFSDLAAPLGLGQIALQMVGWGAEFVDFDGDGWLDLVVANGSTKETGDAPARLEPQPSMLFWNRRGEHFHDLAPGVGPLAEPRVSRGLAVADYDADGDVDLALMRLDGGVSLLANEIENGNWLELRLRSRTASGETLGFADGTTAIVAAGGVEQRRTVGGASYLSQSSRTLHFGLGEAAAIEGVEVRWLGGEPQRFGPLQINRRWELVEGEPVPRLLGAGATVAATPASAPADLDERQRVVAFWQTQRAAMDALKVDRDLERAVGLLREALALDPSHQDSRYYLANCLAALGRPDEALVELQRLLEEDPASHRGQKQWGLLRALTAETDADLAAAEAALERALAINREETGSLLMLGEVALLRGDERAAAERLTWATSTNPRAVGGFFLRAYLAWSAGRKAEARELLQTAHAARGADFVPEGAVAEGDVAFRMHRETSPLSRFWEAWDGDAESPSEVFAPLAAHLRRQPSTGA